MTQTDDDKTGAELRRSYTRREVMKRASQGAALLGGANLLTAWGGSSSGATATAAASSSAGTPVKGGTFNVGMLTGGAAETLVAGLLTAWPDIARGRCLYNWLFDLSADLKTLKPTLAVSAEPNKDATAWILNLRNGVVWHDGKPFTADDVVYTFHYWSNPLTYSNAFLAGLVDFKRVRKMSRLQVEVPMLVPVAQFPSLLTNYLFGVIQNGTSANALVKHPIGTGPFKFVSFTPGQQSTFVAKPHYWEPGLPHVAKVVIDSSFTDENARLNALLGGEINVSAIIPPSVARSQQSGRQVNIIRSPSPQGYYFSMRVDKGPFADVRVRTAMKLLADRRALIAGALDGYGTVANDLLGADTLYYDASLVRPHDVEQAKALFKAARVAGTTFVLQTSAAGAGFVEAATLLAEQATAAGVKIALQTIPSANYFNTTTGYLNRSFAQDSITTAPSLLQAYREFFYTGAPYNETHWGNAGANKLLLQAIGEQNSSKALELWTEVQQLQFNQGGDLVWTNADYLDAASLSVRGLKGSPALNLNNFRLQDGWIKP